MNSEHPVGNYVPKLQPTVLVCVELPLKDADATKEGLFQERIKMKEGEREREREKDESIWLKRVQREDCVYMN